MRHRKTAPASRDDSADLRAAVDSLQRGLEVLRTFTVQNSVLSLGEIATRVALPRNTTERLVKTLVAHGFLQNEPMSDRYRVDAGCQSIGHAVLVNHPLSAAAQPRLQTFADRFEVEVDLSVRDRLDMISVASGKPRDRIDSMTTIGELLPIAATASGHAWLWAQSGAVQGELLGRIRSESSVHSRLMPAIYRSFQELEESGCCVGLDENQIVSLAVPVRSVQAATAVAAVACHVEAGRLKGEAERQSLAAPLVALARDIAEAVDSSTSPE